MLQRHVRPQAGAALGALELRQVHRRDGAGAERAAPSRQAQRAAASWPTAPRDAGVPAPVARFRRRREGGRQAGRSSSSARATTTSRCWRPRPIRTACSAAPCWSRWASSRDRKAEGLAHLAGIACARVIAAQADHCRYDVLLTSSYPRWSHFPWRTEDGGGGDEIGGGRSSGRGAARSPYPPAPRRPKSGSRSAPASMAASAR